MRVAKKMSLHSSKATVIMTGDFAVLKIRRVQILVSVIVTGPMFRPLKFLP